MSRFELFSLEGLRVDGRRHNELRNIHIELSPHITSADGSAYVEQGNTKVVCTVAGPLESPNHVRRLNDRATVTVEVNYAPFCGVDRKRRNRLDKRVAEIQATLQRTFSSHVLTNLYPRSEILITLHVLSLDGSILASLVNATTLALVDAGVSLTDYIVACSAGLSLPLSDNKPSTTLLDLNVIEEGDLPSMTLACVGRQEKIALFNMESRVDLRAVSDMMSAALNGCTRLSVDMDASIRLHGKEIVRIGISR